MGNCAGKGKEPPPAPPPQIQEKVTPILEESPEVIIRKARESMGVDCMNFYNFIVCGQSGVGKSSLVNCLLSLAGDAACAGVGETETTQAIRWYSNKKWPYLKIWDIPGAGTKDHPAESYFKDKKLYAFDAILILSSERFLDVDFKILESAMKYGTPCAFVRTKCDIAVRSRAKRDKVSALEASKRFRADVKRSLRDGLKKAGLSGSDACVTPKLFFISTAHEYSPDQHADYNPSSTTAPSEYVELEEDEAYSIYDPKTKRLDTSLSSMDERLLLAYLVEAAHRRWQTKKPTTSK